MPALTLRPCVYQICDIDLLPTQSSQANSQPPHEVCPHVCAGFGAVAGASLTDAFACHVTAVEVTCAFDQQRKAVQSRQRSSRRCRSVACKG
eukprot:918062-Rhodomonas_salina.2